MNSFAFHHICLCKSSHLCIKLPSSFISLWEACSWFTNQLNMTRMFTLLPGSSWTWGWCFCLLGGTELLLCFSSPPSLQLQGLLFSWYSLPPDKTTLLVLLAGGEVGFLTYIWSGTFTSPTATGSPRPTCFLDFGQPSDTWRLGYFFWVARSCLSDSLCFALYNAKQVLLSYIQDWVRSMEEQEQNSRTRRNMNWSDGSVLVDCGTQFWGTCFSTACKLELLSEVTLSFFCLNMGN